MTLASVQDSIEFEIFVTAPPERIFEALVNPNQVPQWWGGRGAGQSYRCTKFESDVRVGGSWRCIGIDGNGSKFEVSGEYRIVDRPNLLVTTWRASWTGDAETTVSWELVVANRGTQVKICHSGFAAHPEISSAYRGWPMMLQWLRLLLERRETVESRFSQGE
ncbi:MAG TPA: SRPBCC domain-containing protein [Bryobacteraceae bacterium]|nr:SRPBCC domain-containing protein [Bryobacteraceae bacterium]